MSKNLSITYAILLILAFITIIFLANSYSKRFSYWMWYEDLVKETVIETLKEQSE